VPWIKISTVTNMEKLARNIQYSLRVIQSPQYRAWSRNHGWQSAQNIWGPQFMNVMAIGKHGEFKFNDNLNTIKRKLKLIKNMTSKEKALLARLVHPSYHGIGNGVRNNNAHIKPVRNWYIGVLAKKYNVPKNWLNENPAIINSKAGNYAMYGLRKTYTPGNMFGSNKTIAGKQLARKLGALYAKRIERRVSAAKKATKSLPNELREPILNMAFPFTRRHRSVSVGTLFN
jgi:hypothetical protein